MLWLTRSLLGQCLDVRSFKRVPIYPVTSDSHVMTDDHPGYGGLGKHFRRHSTIRGILRRFTPAKKVMSAQTRLRATFRFSSGASMVYIITSENSTCTVT